MNATQRTLHQADCDVWDLPDPRTAPQLHLKPGRDPATDRYLAQIAPAYEVLGRVLAQLSGVFLLALTRDGRGPGLHLDHAVYTIALDQLAEARDILGGALAIEPTQRHKAGLDDLANRLSDAAAGMDRMAGRRYAAQGDTDKQDILKSLAAAQRLLIATAEPDAGITPVDFDNACCNCAMTRTIT